MESEKKTKLESKIQVTELLKLLALLGLAISLGIRIYNKTKVLVKKQERV